MVYVNDPARPQQVVLVDMSPIASIPIMVVKAVSVAISATIDIIEDPTAPIITRKKKR